MWGTRKLSLAESQSTQRGIAATNPRRGSIDKRPGPGAIAYPTTRKTFLSQSRQGAKRTSRSVLSGEKCSLCVSATWREISSRHLQVGLDFRAIAQFNCNEALSLTNARRPNRASSRSQIWRRPHRVSIGPNPSLTGSSLNGRGKSCFLGKFL